MSEIIRFSRTLRKDKEGILGDMADPGSRQNEA